MAKQRKQKKLNESDLLSVAGKQEPNQNTGAEYQEIGGADYSNPGGPVNGAAGLKRDTTVPVGVAAEPQHKVTEDEDEDDFDFDIEFAEEDEVAFDGDDEVNEDHFEGDDAIHATDDKGVNEASTDDDDDFGKSANVVDEEDDSDDEKKDVTEETDLVSDNDNFVKEDEYTGDEIAAKAVKPELALSEDDDNNDGKEDAVDGDGDGKVNEEDEDGKEDEKVVAESAKIKIVLKPEVTKLFESAGLNKKFQGTAKTLFEAAVRTHVRSVAKQLSEAYAKRSRKRIAESRKNDVSRVDQYLTYVVEQWMKKNAPVIEPALKTELMEDFVVGLQRLFKEHYIHVPAGKLDLVKSLAKKQQRIERQLNEATEALMKSRKLNEELVRYKIVNQLSTGLVATDAAKLQKLAEEVKFSGVKDFTAKVRTIKESFKTPVKKQVKLDEQTGNPEKKTVEEKSGNTLVDAALDAALRIK